MHTKANSLPTCEQFATIEEFDEREPGCAVCRHLELSHATAGRRALGAEESRTLRERLVAQSATDYGATNELGHDR